MVEQDLLSGAFNLTLFGMGFVFIFLTLLVFVTKFMSYILNKGNNKNIDKDLNNKQNSLLGKDVIDEETKAVIEQAIKIHTGA